MAVQRRCADCQKPISRNATYCQRCAARRRDTLTVEARARGAFSPQRARLAAYEKHRRDRVNAELVKRGLPPRQEEPHP